MTLNASRRKFASKQRMTQYIVSDSDEKEQLIKELELLKAELGLDDEGLYNTAIKEIERSLRSPNISIYYNRAIDAIGSVINEEHQKELQQYLTGEISFDD